VTLAHLAGVPLEELLPLLPVAGACLLALRARVRAGHRSGERRSPARSK
jgi:hypothetical protein